MILVLDDFFLYKKPKTRVTTTCIYSQQHRIWFVFVVEKVKEEER